VRGRLNAGFLALRATGFAALALLLWNPVATRSEPGGPPLVLLDVSLSMGGQGGPWRAALDTARAVAGSGGGGGVIWRFGSAVRAFDTLPPTDGASRLGPALAAAAARGGPVIVVTDGAIGDVPGLPPDLLRRAKLVVLPRPPFFDAFVASVEGPHRVAAGDTLRLRVSYGTAGERPGNTAGERPVEGRGRAGEGGRGKATLAVTLAGRRLASREVALPDSGIVSTDLTLLASPFPGSSRAFPGSLPAGWSALEVRIEGVSGDSEPRDDARAFAVEVSPAPTIVVLAAPPDWDTRFLARTIADVARAPVKTFVATEGGDGTGARLRWRDAATLAPVTPADVARSTASARLVVVTGDPALLPPAPTPRAAAVLSWPTVGGTPGDWYVEPPAPSPLAGALAGIAWDSLPPAAAAADVPATRDTSVVAVLTARLARRGAARPIVQLAVRGGVRHATVSAAGLYRWAFRGGASAQAYRALVAALADWLLDEEGATGRRERLVPETEVVANGLPLAWRWVGGGHGGRGGRPSDVVLSLGERVDTLRFDATGRAELLLPPGVYRYAAGGGERGPRTDPVRGGLVAVETYSDEWRPAPAVLRVQDGAPAARLVGIGMRDRWWLFVVAIAAFAAEWAWRRRQGLP
jgi:hypothetical protein